MRGLFSKLCGRSTDSGLLSTALFKTDYIYLFYRARPVMAVTR